MFFNAEDFFGGAPRGPVEGSSTDTELYDILEVQKDASATEIKRAYRKLARSHHPDKGGNEEEFKRITSAYEILSNTEKRAQYDRFGKAAFEHGGSSPGFNPFDMPDLFGDLFHRHGGHARSAFSSSSQRQSAPPKPKLIEITVTGIPLQTFYLGGTVSVPSFTRRMQCTACDGIGGSGKVTCSDCNGHGIKVTMRSLGPGMIQQMQTSCARCQGSGHVLKNPCVACRQNGFVPKKITDTTLAILPGTHDRYVAVRKGSGHWKNGMYGDVHIQLVADMTTPYKRLQNHVILEKMITLREALFGFRFLIGPYLDGKQYSFQSAPCVVYADNSLCKISGLGFPSPSALSQQGDLYIHFRVQWPERLSQDVVNHFNHLSVETTDSTATTTGEVTSSSSSSSANTMSVEEHTVEPLVSNLIPKSVQEFIFRTGDIPLNTTAGKPSGKQSGKPSRTSDSDPDETHASDSGCKMQ